MTNLLIELSQVISLLESDIPANPSAPKNQKLVKELERELAGYFKSLEQAFPFDALEQIYLRKSNA